MYVCIYICMYVSIYVCMYLYIVDIGLYVLNTLRLQQYSPVEKKKISVHTYIHTHAYIPTYTHPPYTAHTHCDTHTHAHTPEPSHPSYQHHAHMYIRTSYRSSKWVYTLKARAHILTASIGRRPSHKRTLSGRCLSHKRMPQ